MRSFLVKELDSKIAMDMVLHHHYSHRKVGARFCFGLFGDGDLIGCCVYSQPASYTLCNGVCGPEYSRHVVELSRLVVLSDTKNAASYLIGNSLKRIGNAVVVSYADCNDHVGHVGYVYQATNWIYTGQGNAEPIWINPKTGEVVSYTRRHIDKKAEALGLDWKELVKQKQVGKHRYVFICGDKRFRKEAKQSLRYAEKPYPKGDTKRHVAREGVGTLF